MPDILLATAKGLAGIPGLAPVFNPLITLREEEKLAKANEVLMERISQGQEVSREALRDILVAVLDIREDNQAIQQQMVAGLYAVFKLLLRQQDLLGTLVPGQKHSTGTAALEDAISSLVQDNQRILAAEGLVTLEALRDELTRLFSDEVGTLLAIVQPAGLPQGLVAVNAPPIQAYWKFLQAFEGLDGIDKSRVSQAVARAKPGSELFRAWASLYSSCDR